MKPENNWPLLYYAGMVLFVRGWAPYMEPWFIYAGLIFALLIRFEFASTGFVQLFKLSEGICLVYVLFKTADYFVIF